MDNKRFDALTRSLITRRTGIGLGLASLFGFSAAEAAPNDKKKCQPECPACKRCKQGKCRPKPNGTECGANGLCRGGKCVACPAGKTRCDDACVDLASDPEYCGTCDVACGFDQDCVNGTCGCRNDAECVAANRGNRCCSGTCVNGNCCKNGDCPSQTPACVDYTCAACSNNGQCPAGTICGRTNGTCCGAEGVACSSYTTCCSGSCDTLVGGGTCSSCNGQFCNAQNPCSCGGTQCINNRCGGCLARATVCNGSVPCCNSACAETSPGSGKACLSNAGGRCVNNADCRTCYNNSNNCSGACVSGTCTR